MLIREANCCVAILQNLSLRGNFWPNACSAAIQELQTSLYAKMMDDSVPNQALSGRTYTSISKQPGLASREPIEEDNISGHQSADQYRAGSRLDDIDTRSQATPRRYESENNQNRGQDEAMDISSAGRDPRQLDTQRHVLSYNTGLESQNDISARRFTETLANEEFLSRQNIGNWQNTDGLFSSAGDALNGFGDIFQLVDMSHIMNDQFSQA